MNQQEYLFINDNNNTQGTFWVEPYSCPPLEQRQDQLLLATGFYPIEETNISNEYYYYRNNDFTSGDANSNYSDATTTYSSPSATCSSPPNMEQPCLFSSNESTISTTISADMAPYFGCRRGLGLYFQQEHLSDPECAVIIKQEIGHCGHQYKPQKTVTINSHQKSQHNNNRPFACYSCTRSFARKHDLQRHVRVHTGDKPYSCLNCSKPFARTDALKRHLRMEESCRMSSVVQAMKNTGSRRYRNL